MRTTLLLLFLLGSLLACEPKSCYAKPGGIVDALTYALDVMELRDNPDIRLALALYRRDLKAIDRGVDVTAFRNGTFDRERFVATHSSTKKVEAQAELFETLYIILNQEEKTKLHRLMAAHLHYFELLSKESPQSCDTNITKKSCDISAKGQSASKPCR